MGPCRCNDWRLWSECSRFTIMDSTDSLTKSHNPGPWWIDSLACPFSSSRLCIYKESSFSFNLLHESQSESTTGHPPARIGSTPGHSRPLSSERCAHSLLGKKREREKGKTRIAISTETMQARAAGDACNLPFGFLISGWIPWKERVQAMVPVEAKTHGPGGHDLSCSPTLTHFS